MPTKIFVTVNEVFVRDDKSRINFDMHDCDKILRVEASHIIPEKVIEVMNNHGYQCMVLE